MNGIQLKNYDLAIDVQKDASGLITSGLMVGDILAQNQAIILNMHPGELKGNPTLGVGIADILLDDDPLKWRIKIRESLELDRQSVKKIEITTSSLKLESEYEIRS